ncbi:MAG: asparagine synthase C-terminal domain-containing protein, partial [Bacteroidota bacterium]
SSAIVALMAQASEQPVNTFSIVFEEEAFDESPFSQMMADRYRTRHTPILLRPDDFLRELPAALQAMDSPSGDGINSYVVSKVTRNAGITVALSGLGGDELFAGYPVFTQWMRLQARRSWWGLTRPFRQLAAGLLPLLIKDHRRDRMQAFMRLPGLNMQQAYPLFRTLQTPARISQLQPALPSTYNGVRKRLDTWNGNLSALPQLSQVSVGEISTYTEPVLLRDTDQMSMAHALEVRVPFFDHTLVEYVLGLPDAVKYPHSPKELLVSSLGDLLPHEVVHRPKKGFVFPWEQWLRHELKDFGQQHIDALAQRGIFDGGAVTELWKRFQAQDPTVIWFYVWVLIVLENWLQQNEF